MQKLTSCMYAIHDTCSLFHSTQAVNYVQLIQYLDKLIVCIDTVSRFTANTVCSLCSLMMVSLETKCGFVCRVRWKSMALNGER
jgi:hypothetical protein